MCENFRKANKAFFNIDLLSFENETPEFFTGNYAEYEAYRRDRLGDEAESKGKKYRKIGG